MSSEPREPVENPAGKETGIAGFQTMVTSLPLVAKNGNTNITEKIGDRFPS